MRRYTPEERVRKFAHILRLRRLHGLSLTQACMRCGVLVTSFPELVKSVKRNISRSPDLLLLIDSEDRDMLNG